MKPCPTLSRIAPRAFTLVELLVVISIIGVLVALLLPSLGKARTSARNLLSMVNQRDIVQGVLLYEADFKMFPLLGGCEGRSESPDTNPVGGCVIWGPTGALGVPGYPQLLANTNMALGAGQLLTANYVPYKIFFCPEYQAGTQDGYLDQQGGSAPGRTAAYGKRPFLFGKPYTTSQATVMAYPDGDGEGFAFTSNFVRSDYYYRGSDFSSTPRLSAYLVSDGPVLRAGRGYTRSTFNTPTGGFNVKAITADFRYWRHADDGQYVGRGDNSVVWVSNKRIAAGLAAEVAAGLCTPTVAAQYPFRWVSYNATYSVDWNDGLMRKGITPGVACTMLDKLDQVMANY